VSDSSYLKLRRLLSDTNFKIIPPGEHSISYVYTTVKKEYPELCDDSILSSDVIKSGSDEPAWKHYTRWALQDAKDKGVIEPIERGRYIFRDTNQRSGEKWSLGELEASVKAYLEMRDLQDKTQGQKSIGSRSPRQLIKKKYYEELGEFFGRNPKAFEYRMQNISYVLSLMGRDWISGLKPAKNVGTNVIDNIERLIHKLEDSPNPSIAKFQSEINQIRTSKNIPRPSGSKRPTKTVSEITNYKRDQRIVAWILKESKGVCERCDKPAPFDKIDGDFYLEVHHLKHLADKGSDTLSNTIALCPNCHREMHYGENRNEILNQLYSKIERLVRE